MTLTVRKKALRLWFSVPLSLILYGLSKGMRSKAEFQFELDKQTKKKLKLAVKQAKKNFGNLVLLDVQAADGTRVRIKL